MMVEVVVVEQRRAGWLSALALLAEVWEDGFVDNGPGGVGFDSRAPQGVRRDRDLSLPSRRTPHFSEDGHGI